MVRVKGFLGLDRWPLWDKVVEFKHQQRQIANQIRHDIAANDAIEGRKDLVHRLLRMQSTMQGVVDATIEPRKRYRGLTTRIDTASAAGAAAITAQKCFNEEASASIIELRHKLVELRTAGAQLEEHNWWLGYALRVRNLTIRERDRDLEEVRMVLRERDEDLKEAKEALEVKEKALEEIRDALRRRESDLEERNLLVEEQNGQLEEVRRAAGQREAELVPVSRTQIRKIWYWKRRGESSPPKKKRA